MHQSAGVVLLKNPLFKLEVIPMGRPPAPTPLLHLPLHVQGTEFSALIEQIALTAQVQWVDVSVLKLEIILELQIKTYWEVLRPICKV